MMVLTLLTKQIDGEFTVYWKTGLRRCGEDKGRFRRARQQST